MGTSEEARSSRQTSRPSPSGSDRSRTTASGFSSRAGDGRRAEDLQRFLVKLLVLFMERGVFGKRLVQDGLHLLALLRAGFSRTERAVGHEVDVQPREARTELESAARPVRGGERG